MRAKSRFSVLLYNLSALKRFTSGKKASISWLLRKKCAVDTGKLNLEKQSTQKKKGVLIAIITGTKTLIHLVYHKNDQAEVDPIFMPTPRSTTPSSTLEKQKKQRPLALGRSWVLRQTCLFHLFSLFPKTHTSLSPHQKKTTPLPLISSLPDQSPFPLVPTGGAW